MNTNELIKSLTKLSSDPNFNNYRQSSIELILKNASRSSNLKELIGQVYEFSDYFADQTNLFKDLIYHDICGLGPISLFLTFDDWYMITQNGTQNLRIDFQNTSPIELSIGLFKNRPPNGIYQLVSRQVKRLDEQFPIFSSLVENLHYQVVIPPASSNVWIRVIQMNEFKKDWPDYIP
ncbi:MAG: hypothetical protein AB7I27_00135 [Bacteriovoracaceae bacterium]